MKMNSANGEKTAFMEKELLNATYLPTSYLTDGTHELKTKVAENKSIKMSRIQHFCFTLLIIALLAITIVTATAGSPDRPAPLSTEEQKFQDLLNSVEPSALHDILHEHFKDKYKHGVYQEDKTAMEAVHQQNAEVAHSLIELAKRQAGTSSNGTGTVTTTTAITTIETTTSVVVTPTPTSTPSESSNETPTPTPSESPTSATVSTATTLSTTSSVSTSTSSPPSSTPTSTTPSATKSSASTSSPSQGSSHFSTSSQGSVTQSVVYTTTLADGAQSTVTQITVVPADQAAGQTNGVGTGTSTNTANASLQTSSASISSRRLEVSVCVGMLGLAVAWAL